MTEFYLGNPDQKAGLYDVDNPTADIEIPCQVEHCCHPDCRSEGSCCWCGHTFSAEPDFEPEAEDFTWRPFWRVP